MDKDILIFPPATLVVHDVDGRPIEGARILVHAETQPHAQESDPTVELTTDVDGRATLEEHYEEQRVFPLMMHGVPGHSWKLCVDHPRFGAMLGGWLHYENPNEVVTVLRGTPGTCVGDGAGLRLAGQVAAPPGATDAMGKSPNPDPSDPIAPKPVEGSTAPDAPTNAR
jgi:hypothetical protein